MAEDSPSPLLPGGGGRYLMWPVHGIARVLFGRKSESQQQQPDHINGIGQMAWNNSTMPGLGSQGYSDYSEHGGDDDDMDFYADTQPAAKAGEQPLTPASSFGSNQQQRAMTEAMTLNTLNAGAINKRADAEKLSELRAKLIANRQATPNKDVKNVKLEDASQRESPAPTTKLGLSNDNKSEPKQHPPRPTAASMLSQSNSIDALVAEGQAAAHSSPVMQQKTAPQQQQQRPAPRPANPGATNKSPVVNTTAKQAAQSSSAQKQLDASNQNKAQANLPSSGTPNNSTSNKSTKAQKHPSTAENRSDASQPVVQEHKSPDTNADQHAPASSSSTNNSARPVSTGQKNSVTHEPRKETEDEYFKDVDLWLQITGYHDKAFREQKLRTHKLRAALEEKKRALEREFAELERQEAAAAANDANANDYLRAHSASDMPPPPVPNPETQQQVPTNAHGNSDSKPAGVKRPLSPTASNSNHRDKLGRLDTSGRAVRRDDLFDKPLSAGPSRRGSDQRSHYTTDRSDYRIRGAIDTSPTSHSISVRGQAYNRSPSPFGRRPDPWAPRSPEYRTRGGYPSRSFSEVNEQPIGGGYSGNKSVRYFMIKSWNHANVMEAQQDNVWATQEKNTQMFADAFDSCRSVILLFSVNKSMAFQGAAVMTSPPSPSVPSPAFCRKLKWPTSPAFRIRWIATTPVHFRFVGHLKNSMNPDESGEPRAVLVGKDGQEVSREAGEGVVNVLRGKEEQAVGREERERGGDEWSDVHRP